jgi:predicted transcriptional regulator
VIRAVEIARERGASEQMVERAAKAEQRAAELAREVGRLRSALDEARRAAERGLKADGKPSEW